MREETLQELKDKREHCRENCRDCYDPLNLNQSEDCKECGLAAVIERYNKRIEVIE